MGEQDRIRRIVAEEERVRNDEDFLTFNVRDGRLRTASDKDDRDMMAVKPEDLGFANCRPHSCQAGLVWRTRGAMS